MTTASFDETIHPPNRLQICAMLAVADSVQFAVLRDELGVSDSVLSKQLRILQEAGYVTSTKARHDMRRRTWFWLTTRGRQAFERHVAELRRIAGPAE